MAQDNGSICGGPADKGGAVRDTSVGSGRLNRLTDHARQALRQGRFQDALDLCERILTRHPDHAEACYIQGMSAGGLRRFAAAVAALERACALRPDHAGYQGQKARFLLAMADYRAATAAALRAHDLMLESTPDAGGNTDRDTAFDCDTIGCVLSRTGLQKEAAALFARATALAPDNHGYQYNHGNALRFLGDFDRAAAAFERTLSREPGHYKALWALSALKKQTPTDNHIARLTAAVGQLGDHAEALSFLHYALGKEYEDLADYDAAFTHFSRGAAARRSLLAYDMGRDEALVDSLIRSFDPIWRRQAPGGCDSEEPIFIFGLPRSGTTLVERIISSHSAVFAAGELLNFPVAAKRLSAVAGPDLLTPAVVRALRAADMGALGRNYLDSTRATTGGAARFIDKLPFNFLYVGLIAQALPRARLIHLTRQPMDSCFSMFKQQFAEAYPYTYDLAELGRYYLLYRRLMAHWRAVLPGRILDVSYERLVADQDGVSREVIAHCGLDWQDRCLTFHQNREAVATASAAQVRQPIYRGSVGKWRCYEKHLSPLREILAAGGCEVD